MLFPQIGQAVWEQVPVPAPDTLGPTEILVQAACTLVSAGTETAIYSGTHIGYRTPGATYPRMPHRPGYAFAGTVRAVGPAVETVRPGDRICGSLPHAAWVVTDARRADLLQRVPNALSFEQACLARLAIIALQGVRLARVRLGERGAVFGQGLIGQFARQLLALDGAAVTVAVDLLDHRLDLARRHGATHTVNPARQDVAAALREATGGQGVDVAIEATGNPAVINDALAVAADLGRVILLGSPRGKVEIDPYHDIHRKGVALIGAHARTAAERPNAHYRWTGAEHLRVTLELIRQGRLHTDGLVSHHVPAAEALGVWDALVARPQEHLGVLIVWDPDQAS